MEASPSPPSVTTKHSTQPEGTTVRRFSRGHPDGRREATGSAPTGQVHGGHAARGWVVSAGARARPAAAQPAAQRSAGPSGTPWTPLDPAGPTGRARSRGAPRSPVRPRPGVCAPPSRRPAGPPSTPPTTRVPRRPCRGRAAGGQWSLRSVPVGSQSPATATAASPAIVPDRPPARGSPAGICLTASRTARPPSSQRVPRAVTQGRTHGLRGGSRPTGQTHAASPAQSQAGRTKGPPPAASPEGCGPGLTPTASAREAGAGGRRPRTALAAGLGRTRLLGPVRLALAGAARKQH